MPPVFLITVIDYRPNERRRHSTRVEQRSAASARDVVPLGSGTAGGADEGIAEPSPPLDGSAGGGSALPELVGSLLELDVDVVSVTVEPTGTDVKVTLVPSVETTVVELPFPPTVGASRLRIDQCA